MITSIPKIFSFFYSSLRSCKLARRNFRFSLAYAFYALENLFALAATYKPHHFYRISVLDHPFSERGFRYDLPVAFYRHISAGISVLRQIVQDGFSCGIRRLFSVDCYHLALLSSSCKALPLPLRSCASLRSHTPRYDYGLLRGLPLSQSCLPFGFHGAPQCRLMTL